MNGSGRAIVWWIVCVVVLALIAGGLWYLQRPAPDEREIDRVEEPAAYEPADAEVETAETETEPADTEREVDYPVPETEPEEVPRIVTDIMTTDPEDSPLPPLEQSDDAIEEDLSAVVELDRLDEWLRPEDIVRRTVVTINSLDGEHIALRFWPVHHIEGRPEVMPLDEEDERYEWTPDNQQRYDTPVRMLVATEPQAMAELYFRYYPLFQAAYEEIGHPDAHFNDRLIAIIDHLLDMPAARPTYELRRPEVLYEFADPALEAESWGRKAMLRMGPDNARAVRAWLEEFRAEIIAGAETDASP